MGCDTDSSEDSPQFGPEQMLEITKVVTARLDQLIAEDPEDWNRRHCLRER
jgi:hypothetical protein